MSTHRIAICLALALLLTGAGLLHPVSGVGAREFQVASQSYLGGAEMTVSYNASSTATVGSNLTVTAQVTVGNFSGSELYVRDYVLVVTLFCDDRSSNVTAGSQVPTQRFLYPGARWGPFNVTVPVTESDTGLRQGEDANASLTLSLIADIAYSSPGYGISGYTPVSGGGSAWVVVSDPAGASSSPVPTPALSVPVIPSALVGGGLALLALRIAFFRVRRD